MKIIISIILCLFIVLKINSQELNQDFLNSLPNDIKADLLERNADNAKNHENKFKPYTYSSKLEQKEDLESLKERLELDLQELENRLNENDDISINDGLQLFGSDFFNTFQTSFMPINEPNPGSDYFLDIGDILNIQLIGQKNSINDYVIRGDGSISIEKIGKLTIAGMSLVKLYLQLKER